MNKVNALVEVNPEGNIVPLLQSSDAFLDVYARKVKGCGMVCSTEYYRENPIVRLYDKTVIVIGNDRSLPVSKGHILCAPDDITVVIYGYDCDQKWFIPGDTVILTQYSEMITDYFVSVNHGKDASVTPHKFTLPKRLTQQLIAIDHNCVITHNA